MTNNNNDLDKINKNILVKSYLIGCIPVLILAWFLSGFLEESFLKALLIIGAVYLGWIIVRAIYTSIIFHLFFKKDLMELSLHELKLNNFPEPEDYEIENVETYLETVAMDPNNHPRNIVAATMYNEISSLRRQGKILALARMHKVMGNALKKYQYQLKRE